MYILFFFIAIVAVYFFYAVTKANKARKHNMREEKMEWQQAYLNAMLKNKNSSREEKKNPND
ncbi:MAG: hypothetical protein J0I41_05945 [Filimonas sp.]|nr:hypothetical protein [Filimonas sp.]